MRPSKDEFPLPEGALPLGLRLSFPASCWESLMRGYESQSQDDKWSVYGQEPWVQIWRPMRPGLYCYAVRFEMRPDERFEIAEAWGSKQIVKHFDLEASHEIVTFVLDFVAGYRRGEFSYRLLQGTRKKQTVSFHGEVSTSADIDELTQQLREQVAQLGLEDG